MPKLTEKFIQNKALGYLSSYYLVKQPNIKMFSQTEVVTKYRNKPGRADGLLAFRKNGNRIYTVSLEAKSHKTFNSLKNIAKDTHLILTLIGSSIAIAIGFWFVLGNTVWWLKLLIALVAGLILGFLVTILLFNREFFDTNGIIEQVKRYPADERWIAISVDAYNKYNNREGNLLFLKAKASGIGLIIVGAGDRIEIKSEAKQPKIVVPRSYIHYYKKYKSIINFLTTN